MTSSENEHLRNPEHSRPLEAISEPKWENVTGHFDAEVARLKEWNIESGFILFDDGDPTRQHSHDADTSFFSASTGKLEAAEAMVAAQLPADYEISYPAKMVDLTGGGVLDTASLKDRVLNKTYTTTAGEAVRHMLEDSSNTPVRLIAELFSDKGAHLRQVYKDMGYEKTTLEPHPNGRFDMSDTTPRESLQSLRNLLAFPAANRNSPTDPNAEHPSDDTLAPIAAEALWSNTVTNHGIRQGIRPSESNGIRVANKSGEYNGDEDTPAVRHDVFVITDGHRQLSGAFFTKGNEGSIDEADRALKRLGKELGHAMGSVNDRLGTTATQDMIKPPEA